LKSGALLLLSKKTKKKYDERAYEGGRYPSIIYAENETDGSRGIFIKENLHIAPLEEEMRKYNKNLVWKGKEAARVTSIAPDVNSLVAGTVAVPPVYDAEGGESVAVPQRAVLRDRVDDGNGEPEIEAVPLSYQQIWRLSG
jgi:hypothetical protein